MHRCLAESLDPANIPKDEDDPEQQDHEALIEELCKRSNEKKRSAKECSEACDRSFFCMMLRNKKEYFLTVGNVLKVDDRSIVVHSSMMSKEKRVYFITKSDTSEMPEILKVENTALPPIELPEEWDSDKNTNCIVHWQDDKRMGMEVGEDGKIRTVCNTQKQHLRLLSAVPILLAPVDQVPIDFAVFLLSPFHPEYDRLLAEAGGETGLHGFERVPKDDDEEWDEPVDPQNPGAANFLGRKMKPEPKSAGDFL